MIELSEEYYLETDRYNLTLKHLHYIKNNNEIKPKFVDIGYYSNISTLYSAILEHQIKLHPEVLTNLESLLQLKNYIEKIGQTLLKLTNQSCNTSKSQK